MLFSLVFLMTAALANESTMSYDDALKKCSQSIRWGYFLQDFQTIKKLGGRISLWGDKDLKGKFKSQEECNYDRMKQKFPHLAEDCQMFSIGKDLVLFSAYRIEAKMNLDKESSTKLSVFFKEKESCDQASAKGGKFKIENSVQSISPLGEKAQTYFNSECGQVKMIMCEPKKTPVEYIDLN